MSFDFRSGEKDVKFDAAKFRVKEVNATLHDMKLNSAIETSSYIIQETINSGERFPSKKVSPKGSGNNFSSQLSTNAIPDKVEPKSPILKNKMLRPERDFILKKAVIKERLLMNMNSRNQESAIRSVLDTRRLDLVEQPNFLR